MTPERWAKVDEVFAGTAGLSGDELRLYLDRECHGDPDLRREVQALIAYSPNGDNDNLLHGVLEQAAELLTDTRSSITRQIAEQRIGLQLGHYRLVKVIGTGGMGIVYLGVRDDDLQQTVAIKLIQAGHDSKYVLDRFRQERRILAQLQHPAIARFIDGGLTPEGHPYYVMEYVEDGLSITEYCRVHKLDIERRVRLFLHACEAVNHAHRNLVVHRDLKPGNILVGSNGNVKLLDFGIAKVLDTDSAIAVAGKTQTMLRMLTPDYASPEQVLAQPITTATDVYSLGAILYELLSGFQAHRFRNYSNSEIERVICLQDPPPPSHAAAGMDPVLARSIHTDLDSIVAMAMRKEPGRRYQSVEQLVDDLNRYLTGKTVHAHRGTIRYRAGKFLRRHKLMLAASAALLITLIGGIAATTYQARRAERRFQQVRSLAATLLNDLDTRIASLPQSSALREWLSSTVVQYLDNLAGEAGNDASLQMELAAGYLKVAQLQANLAQNARALESYTKSAAIYEALHSSRPNDPAVLSGLCQCLRQLGQAANFSGDLASARSNLGRATQLGDALHRLSPVEGSRCLAGALSAMVAVEMRSSNARAALTHLSRAIEQARLLDEAQPSRQAKEQLLAIWLDTAWANMENGNPAAGMDAIHQAESIGKSMMPPAEWDTFRLRFRMLDLAGDLSGNPRDIHLLDPDAALASYREALRIAEIDYARDTQNAIARRNVDRMLRKTALMLVDAHPEQAMALARRALQLSEIHLLSSPGNPEYTRDHVDGILISGYGLQNLKRHTEALEYLRKALAEQLQVERFSPDAKRFQRELQETYEALGDTHLALGDQQQALFHYEKGRERTVALLWDRPTDAYLKRDLADSDEKIAGIYAVMARKPTPDSRSHWQQALEYQKRSVDTWSRWPREVAPSEFQKMREQRARQLLDAYQREAAKSL